MTNQSKKKLAERLLFFDQNLERLAQIHKINWEELKEKPHILAAMMYYLFVLISSILDLGAHILSSEFKESISTYRDVLEKLKTHNVISPELYARNQEMPSFRNVLAHQYGSVDMKKVYDFLQEHFEDLKEFGSIFSRYIEEK